MDHQLSATLEDYLQAVFRLEKEKGFARVRDISDALGVAKSAATTALQNLSAKGLVNYAPYEPATMTEEGWQRARKIVLRRRVIEEFLRSVLCLDADRSGEIACGMEHAVDREAMNRLSCFLAFVGQRREAGESWLAEFRQFIDDGNADRSCEEYMQQYLASAGIESPDQA